MFSCAVSHGFSYAKEKPGKEVRLSNPIITDFGRDLRGKVYFRKQAAWTNLALHLTYDHEELLPFEIVSYADSSKKSTAVSAKILMPFLSVSCVE